jgi:methylenetetrahydrofolate--tRNA-(uracil-5-)-methyltransferase
VSRGPETLRFGPMKPIGITDPRTGDRPWAVAQLRREDRAGQMWNLVGFQTRLRIGEQKRVFRMIPGLEEAEFFRFGSIHRNSYLNFPARLTRHGSLPDRPDLVFAGQITGVEGYTESAASGILAGVNLDRVIRGLEPVVPPPTTMLGGLYRYLAESDPKHFQPINSNWGLVDPLPGRIRDKGKKREMLGERAWEDFRAWMAEVAPERRPVDRARTPRARPRWGGRFLAPPARRAPALRPHGGGVPPGSLGLLRLPHRPLRDPGMELGARGPDGAPGVPGRR